MPRQTISLQIELIDETNKNNFLDLTGAEYGICNYSEYLVMVRNPKIKFRDQNFCKWWEKACSILNIEGVDLYGGTRHSTATALLQFFSPEEIRRSGHYTQLTRPLIDI